MGVAAAEVVGGAVLTGTALYYANLQKSVFLAFLTVN